MYAYVFAVSTRYKHVNKQYFTPAVLAQYTSSTNTLFCHSDSSAISRRAAHPPAAVAVVPVKVLQLPPHLSHLLLATLYLANMPEYSRQ